MCFSLLLPCALAAPVPPGKPAREKGPWFDGWDKPVDPKGDSRFDRKGGRLTLTVPGKGRVIGMARARGRYLLRAGATAPRLLRDVSGDFTVQARVSGSASGKAVRRGAYRAGLVLLDGEVIVQRFLYYPVGRRPRHLMVERKGARVATRESSDGKRWEEDDKSWLEVKQLPQRLKVGVVAEAEGEDSPAFTAVFDELKFTRTKPAKK